MKTVRILLLSLCIVALAACDGGGGSGGGTDFNDFNGGGGTGNAALVGTWSSTTMEGTVTYNMPNLTNLANSNMSSLTINGVYVLKFESNGNVTVTSFGVTQSGTYKYSGTSLVLTHAEKNSLTWTTTVSGTTMKIKFSAGDGWGEELAEAIGEHICNANSTTMAAIGAVVQAANLTIVLEKAQ